MHELGLAHCLSVCTDLAMASSLWQGATTRAGRPDLSSARLSAPPPHRQVCCVVSASCSRKPHACGMLLFMCISFSIKTDPAPVPHRHARARPACAASAGAAQRTPRSGGSTPAPATPPASSGGGVVCLAFCWDAQMAHRGAGCVAPHDMALRRYTNRVSATNAEGLSDPAEAA